MTSGEIFIEAILKWGTGSQMLKTVEEASELIVAIMHRMDGKGSNEALADEVADMIIMISQMRMICGTEDVDKIVDAKMKRLETMLLSDNGRNK